MSFSEPLDRDQQRSRSSHASPVRLAAPKALIFPEPPLGTRGLGKRPSRRQLTRNDHRNFSLARGTSFWQLAHCPRGPGAVPLPCLGAGPCTIRWNLPLSLCLAQSGHRLSGCSLTRHGPAHLPGSRHGPCPKPGSFVMPSSQSIVPGSGRDTKRRGRPATGSDPMMGFRTPPILRAAIVKWAESQPDQPTLSEATRRLIEQALGIATKAKQPRPLPAIRAKELATKAIEKIS